MHQDEDDPAVCMELVGLTEGLSSWLGEDLDSNELLSIQEFIEEHRKNAKRKGIDFPKLIVLVIPRLGWIKVVREDLTELNLRRAVIALLRECPSVNREEIAEAIKRAWPYRGTSTLIDEAEFKISNPYQGVKFDG